VAAAPIEQKFWRNFCRLIDLPDQFRTHHSDSAAIDAIKEIISRHPANYWQSVFEQSDCCCTIVQTLEQALADSHFQYRELFEQQITNENGEQMSALPVCVLKQFRNNNNNKSSKAPRLGQDNTTHGI
jgi:crotonobetainyl-CoA:carnitine CoA-transferase CaiB-like acyl-CoA transferase